MLECFQCLFTSLYINLYLDLYNFTKYFDEVLDLVIKHGLHILGREDIKLKQAQYDAIHSIVCGKKDVLAVLPTGF
jgi:hypothetical protein